MSSSRSVDAMTFDEFLEDCREKDGWGLYEDMIRNKEGQCPLEAVFGGRARFVEGWRAEGGAADAARQAGLLPSRIMRAADNWTGSKYRKALLTLVKETP